MKRYMVGLDVGTTKICAVVASAGRQGPEIIAVGMSPSDGLKKGVVVDMEAARGSIAKAVKEAEANSGVNIKAAYVGIAGGHVGCVESYGATGIKGREVGDSDIARVMDSASAVYMPLDRDILHVIPSEFVIDGQDGIMRPMGMSGVRLEVKVNIITASHAAVENLLKCSGRAGLKVLDVVLQPLASAQAVLKKDEMQEGAVLMDIGGGTSDIAVYKNGTLRYASVIPIGGNHFTNDISIGMRLPQKEAERIKKLFGLPAAPETAEASSLSGEARRVEWRQVADILRPRCEELFELVSKDISGVILRHTPSCAVLTGGSSLLRGIGKTAEAVLGLPARIGLPGRAKSALLKDLASNPVYSTGVGLVLYGFSREFSGGTNDDYIGLLFEKAGGLAKGAFGVRGWGGGLRRFLTKVQNFEF